MRDFVPNLPAQVKLLIFYSNQNVKEMKHINLIQISINVKNYFKQLQNIIILNNSMLHKD